MAVKIDRYTIYQALAQLSDDKLEDVFRFIRFLQFTEQSSYDYEASSYQTLREKLATDYDILAASYAEIADELTDELWLAAENEALQHTEGTTDDHQSG